MPTKIKASNTSQAAALDASAGGDGALAIEVGPAGSPVQALELDSAGGMKNKSLPMFACRAWAVFDGTLTGTNAPTAGGNVASVTRNSTGDYTVNFTNAMPDANYAVSVLQSSGAAQPTGGSTSLQGVTIYSKTTTSFRVQTVYYTGASSTISVSDIPATSCSLVVFR